MAYQLYTEIIINAPKSTIWELLTKTKNFPNWNPFIVDIKGEFKLGNKLEVKLKPANGKSMQFKPMVTEVKEEKKIKWLGSLGIKGIFDGEHCFEIEELTANQCKFKQYENFSGILVPFLKKSLERNTKAGFKNMNEALKSLAEKS